MAINNTPIFVGTPVYNSVRISGGTGAFNINNGTNCQLLFQSNQTNGSFLQKVRCKIVGSGSFDSGTASDTVIKIMVSNANDGTGLRFFDEVYIPTTTLTKTTISPNYESYLNLPLKAGASVWVGWSQSAGAGGTIDITAVGGDY